VVGLEWYPCGKLKHIKLVSYSATVHICSFTVREERRLRVFDNRVFAVKQIWASLTIGWVTACKHLVLLAFILKWVALAQLE